MSLQTSYGQCPECGEYAFLPHRKCPDFFTVHYADYHDDEPGDKVRAYSAAMAAQKWADAYDSQGLEYAIILAWEDHGQRREVTVTSEAGVITKCEVWGERQSVYYSQEIH